MGTAIPQATPTPQRTTTALAPQPTATAIVTPKAASTVAAKPPLTSAMTSLTGTAADPWLRAAMLTPSVTTFMTATRVGAIDPSWQYDLLHKPSQALAMTFSADPQPGMVADRFTGSAVVFLATATFNIQTASLR